MVSNRKKQILLLCFSLTFALIGAELGLRWLGVQPGKLQSSRWFHEVDSLMEIKGFNADSSGIFRVSEEARIWIDSVIESERTNKTYTTLRELDPSLAYEVYSMSFEYLQLIHGQVSNPLADYYKNIQRKKVHDTDDSLILEYIYHPINKEGFRSVPFHPYHGAKKKVLLIGDSFTWGHSAYFITNSFSDHLLAKGYVVYNAGISGADPAQYLALAEKLIPTLLPDYVVVNFYLGNDVIYFNRQPEPGVPIFYSTNAGNLISAPQHRYFYNYKDAYNFALACTNVPSYTFLGRMSYYSSLLTLPFYVGSKLGMKFTFAPEYRGYFNEVVANTLRAPSANQQMAAIEKLAHLHGAKFGLTIIPSIGRFGKLTHPKDFAGLFANHLYFYPTSLTFDHYRRDDGHFNDEGQPVYADFIDEVIKGLK